MLPHILTVIGYVAVTLLVQGTSHFVVNAAHYAAVPHIRPEPLIAFGILSMVVQGTILSVVYAQRRGGETGPGGALRLAWAFGGFLLSYTALAEVGKYAVPDPASWIAVETGAAAVQYTLVGLVLWAAHARTGQRQGAISG